MENDPVKKFLGEFEEEKNGFDEDPENPFGNLDKPEDQEIEKEKIEEKPLPFNKDPKIQRYLQKEMNKLRDEFTSTQVQIPEKNEDTTSVVDAFSAIIGNDTPEKVAALKALENALNKADDRVSKKAIEHLETLNQQENLADQQAEEELYDAFDSIEENYGVDITSDTNSARKTRTEFIDFVEKIAPKRNGVIIDYPDMNSAWETFSAVKKASQAPSRAKEIASRGMTRSAEAVSNEPQKRITFEDADNYIASLK